ncbi:MAG: hypothetical protein LQ340_003995, partial [Diploschistes diacapsis]
MPKPYGKISLDNLSFGKEWTRYASQRKAVSQGASEEKPFSGNKIVQQSKRPPKALQLLDIAALRKQEALWNELLLLRQSRDGKEGAKAVWKKFRSFHTKDVPVLYDAPDLWNAIQGLALEDRDLRDSLIEYVREVYVHSRRSPPQRDNFYCTMIKYALDQGREATLSCHERLKFMEPLQTQLGELVAEIAGDPRGNIFREFCTRIPTFKQMQGYIAPALCQRYDFQTVYSWYSFLISNDDLPEPAHVDQLRRSYRKFGAPPPPLRACKDRPFLAPQGLQVVEAKNEDTLDQRSLLQTLERQIRFRNISRKTISDKTCARFFATSFFSVESVINGLRLVNVEALGPHSLRTLLNRVVKNGTCDIDLAEKHLDALKKAGITLDNSRFCRLVENLVAEGQSQILHDVVVCDLHADTFEDPDLQEVLLAQFVTTGDHRQLNRTLAILCFGSPKRTRDVQVRNCLLRAAIRRGDELSVFKSIEEMCDTHAPVTHRTRQFMIDTTVKIETFPGVSESRLMNTINIWKRLVVYGTVIDPFEWLGLLRLCRQIVKPCMFKTYTDLLTWLALHYPRGELQQSLTSSRLYADGRPKRLLERANFWAVLFPARELWEFLRYSMTVAAVDPESYQLLRGDNLEERIQSLVSHQSLQGVRFLEKLKQLGVPFREDSVRRACQARLKFFYGQIGSERKAQRHMKRFRMLATMEEYILAMETIWESNLFSRKVAVDKFGELLLPTELRKVSHQERDLSYFRLPTDAAPANEDDGEGNAETYDTNQEEWPELLEDSRLKGIDKALEIYENIHLNNTEEKVQQGTAKGVGVIVHEGIEKDEAREIEDVLDRDTSNRDTS